MRIIVFGYELNINIKKVSQLRRIVCEGCGQNAVVWYDMDICEPCNDLQLAADRAEDLMLNWVDQANQAKG